MPNRNGWLAVSAVIFFLAGCGQESSDGVAVDSGVPEDVIRQNTLGTAYLGQQEWGNAAFAFETALAERPNDPLLLSNAAVALIQDGNPEGAETRLQAALVADPDYPYAHYNLGLIESNRGDFEAAVRHFEVVAAFDAADVLTQYHLGITYASLDRSEEALAALRKALEGDPDHVSSLYALGRELVKIGNQDEGRELITRSQEIRARSGLDTAVGLQYGEQGDYALGIDYLGDRLATTDKLALSFATAGTHPGDANAWTVGRMAAGGNAVVAIAGGESTSDDVASIPAPASGSVLSIVAGDGDGDEIVEYYALLGGAGATVSLAVVEQGEDGSLSWNTEAQLDASGVLSGAIESGGLLLVDREHDGDLDIVVCWGPGGGCAVATNDGSGAFTVAASSEHGFEIGDGSNAKLQLTDFDNDRDIDFAVATASGIALLSNQRDGTFTDVGDTVGLGSAAAGSNDFALVDLNKDGWMDVVTGDADGLRWYENRRGRYQAAEVVAGHSSAVTSFGVFDADNDGFLDLAVSNAGGDPVSTVYRNEGSGNWSAATDWLGDLAGVAVHASVDIDNDGDLDVVGHANDAVAIVRNDGGSEHNWISVESRGVGDNRYGIGSKVEVLAGGLRQKFEITSSLPVHVGLGTRSEVDSVRHLWPSGVLQDEIQQPAGAAATITQLDRKGTSCPILYSYVDGRWEFVTDFLGGSAIGYQQAPGKFSTPDTDEYILLEKAPTVAEDGSVRLRVNNQLQEIIWFDQLELVAVDHPEGTELYPNERLMPRPPFPEHAVFVSDRVKPIRTAVDPNDDRDWTAALAERDGRYVDNFRHERFKGYAEMHTIELDLGEFDRDERIVMLLDGWIDYADSTANVGAAQAGLVLTPPFLTITDGNGGWKETGHLMGFPAGLPKTMSVDLTGLFGSDDHRVRIETNMRIYWDKARVMVGGEDLEFVTHRMTPVEADLDYGGFPLEVGANRKTPKSYNPERVSAVTPWKAHEGRYTGFGDVSGLVADIDDRMVTTKAGDQIELRFQSPGPVPAGHTRTWMLFADGFGKDMDPNSAANATVGPMPFHGMPTYPYSASVVPPVDFSESLTRRVSDFGDGSPGSLPIALAERRDESLQTEGHMTSVDDD